MKRVFSLLLILLLVLCGCGEEPIDDTPPQGEVDLPVEEETSNIVIPIGERADEGVKMTIYGGLLGNDSEVLSQTQIDNGFIDAVRNEDDSVTYTIAADRYDGFIADFRARAKRSIEMTAEDGNYASLIAVECTDDLSAIKLTVDEGLYSQSMDALAVFGTGLIAVTAQSYDIDAPGVCIITVVNEAGEEISRTEYPKELIL